MGKRNGLPEGLANTESFSVFTAKGMPHRPATTSLRPQSAGASALGGNVLDIGPEVRSRGLARRCRNVLMKGVHRHKRTKQCRYGDVRNGAYSGMVTRGQNHAGGTNCPQSMFFVNLHLG